MSSAQRIYLYRLNKNREAYRKCLFKNSWYVNKGLAKEELSALELLKPYHVYLITRLRDGEHALFYPKHYYLNYVKFWNLAECGRVCSMSSSDIEKDTTKISYSLLGQGIVFSVVPVPRTDLPLYVGMERVYPGLEKVLSGKWRLDP